MTHTINTSDLTFTFLVDKAPAEVFRSILAMRKWWSKGIEGNTEKLHDQFTYRYKDLHYSTQTLTELIPDEKVVWLVTDSTLTFLENKGEWTGTKFGFEVSKKGNKTEVQFVHYGLKPGCECYEACSEGWGHYIMQSLVSLINTGKGQPD